MKQLNGLKTWFACLMLQVISIATFAQDSTKSSSTSTTTSTSWYVSPWAWIIGGIVVVLIIIALMRGSDTSTSTRETTIIKD